MNLRIQTGVILLSRVIVNDFSSDEDLQISVGFPVDEIVESDEVVLTETKMRMNEWQKVSSILVTKFIVFSAKIMKTTKLLDCVNCCGYYYKGSEQIKYPGLFSPL